MATHSRTLLLLGFTTLAAASLPGCIVETSSGPIYDSDGDGIDDRYDICPYDYETFNGYQDGDGCPDVAGSCLDSQFFQVRWEVDNGTNQPMLLCPETPPSHVELTTNAGQILVVNGTCVADTLYNWSGFTQAGIPAGTTVTLAELISDVDGGLLSAAEVPPSARRAIGNCISVLHTFEFPLGP